MQFVCSLPVHNYSYALNLEAVASSLYVVHLKHKDMIRLRVLCGHAWRKAFFRDKTSLFGLGLVYGMHLVCTVGISFVWQASSLYCWHLVCMAGIYFVRQASSLYDRHLVCTASIYM